MISRFMHYLKTEHDSMPNSSLVSASQMHLTLNIFEFWTVGRTKEVISGHHQIVYTVLLALFRRFKDKMIY